MDNEVKNKEKQFYYCNLAAIEVGTYDFKIALGRIKESRRVNIEEDIDLEVSMSPQHAKALLKMLADNVAKYEEVFGTINVDPKEGVVK